MKVYNFSNFLRLPPGTLFAQISDSPAGDLRIKGDSLPSDFFYRSICEIDFQNTEDYITKMDSMLERKESYPINETYTRHGLFEGTFLVFEEMDLRKIIVWLLDSYYLRFHK